jgi:nicotianamine synthase
MLQTTIQHIQQLDDLKPSPKVNQLFSQLVLEVIAAPQDATFDPQTRRSLQQIASAAETEMELYWARKIVASPNPAQALAAFPYCDNYEKLVGREIRLIEESGLPIDASSRILMIGTGPLPMTGLEFMRQRAARVDHMDISLQALALCSLVSNRLGLACGHILGDGAVVELTDQYDVIVVAGLAGENAPAKQAILDNTLPSLAANGRLLLRSARGARTLLYPGVLASDFAHIELLQEHHPTDDIINSIFVYKKEA